MSIHPSLVIQKKRDGGELSPTEIKDFIHGMLSGEVADYQVSAWLMAVFFQGMTLNETVALTQIMADSGKRYDLSRLKGPLVDKHSTGGVGDKVSLILAPLAAACGLQVPMMAGRGLGHTGGTIDKLESISGFRVEFTDEDFISAIEKIGVAMVGQTGQIAPADKRLYALRDVTATIECIPLIVGSILSKKIAEGAKYLVMDIKVGSGAFMKTKESARKLGKTLISVGKKCGLEVRVLITDMNQPLGYACGNSVEVIESVEILKNIRASDHGFWAQHFSKAAFVSTGVSAGLNSAGNSGTHYAGLGTDPLKSVPGPMVSTDLRELTLRLAAEMLDLSKKCRGLTVARKLAQEKLEDGSAFKVFRELVKTQGGDVRDVDSLDRLPLSKRTLVIHAPRSGYFSSIDTENLGHLLVDLGAGRKKTHDKINPSVGCLMHRKLGSKINEGEPMATFFIHENTNPALVEDSFLGLIKVTATRKPLPKLVVERLV